MQVLALILTLSQGSIEVRQEQSFRTEYECRVFMRERYNSLQSGQAVACVSPEDFERGLVAWFGHRG